MARKQTRRGHKAGTQTRKQRARPPEHLPAVNTSAVIPKAVQALPVNVNHVGPARNPLQKLDMAETDIFVIHLPNLAYRWRRFTGQAAVKDLKKVRMFPAFNGKTLDYVRDKRISTRTKLNIFRNYRRSHYEVATLGAVGASISHLGVWKRFLKSGAPYCIVMEDDCEIKPEDVERIHAVAKTAPPLADMWILGYYNPNLVYEPMADGWNKVYNFTAAHAYVITRKCAQAFVDANPLPVDMHIEYFMTATALLRDLTIIQHKDIHLGFFGDEHGPRVKDSNTSQHKKNGCPSCDAPDDLSQFYHEYGPKTDHGRRVHGVVLNGQQPRQLRKLKD